jgi:hypothetical protein
VGKAATGIRDAAASIEQVNRVLPCGQYRQLLGGGSNAPARPVAAFAMRRSCKPPFENAPMPGIEFAGQ